MRLALPRRPALDALLVALALEDAVNIDAGRVNVVRIERPARDELLDLRDGHRGGSGHHRVEVHRRVPVDEVAEAVAPPRLHDREVAADGRLEDERAPVEDARLFPG